MSKGIVYLIHFEKPYKGVQHYIEWSHDEKTYEQRIADHKNGNGSRLMQVIKENKIDWQVIRLWFNKDRNFERELKRQKNSKRLCCICNPINCWKHKNKS